MDGVIGKMTAVSNAAAGHSQSCCVRFAMAINALAAIRIALSY
jgi:hypothetical protein